MYTWVSLQDDISADQWIWVYIFPIHVCTPNMRFLILNRRSSLVGIEPESFTP